MADEAKAKGNEHFKKQEYDEAIKYYTEGIELDGTAHALFSNRSACYAGLKNYEKALEDAESCIKVKPDWPKGFTRKGAALHGLHKYREAAEAYEEGLKIAPEDAGLKSGLAEVKKEGSAAGANSIGQLFNTPEAQAKLRSNPETAAFMNDPQFMQSLAMAQANPQMFNMLLQQDPRMMKALSVVMGVDIQGAGAGPGAGAPPPEPPKPPPKKPEPKPEPVKELTEEEKAAKAKHDEAVVEKEKGTKAYKAKDFETAIACYTKAFEIDGSDMAFLTNRAACHFEKGDYEACIADCKQAIEVGREHRTDFKVMARAYARIGNSYAKMAVKGPAEDMEANFDNAIAAYNSSLTEHRTDDVWTKLKTVQKEKKKRKELAYIDPVKAAEEKEKATALFKEGKWVEAMRGYDECIKRNPSDPDNTHIYFSNKGTCFIRMNQMELALEAFDESIKLNPNYAKAHLNKAHIMFTRKEYQKVSPIYQAVLDIPDIDEDSKKKAMEGLQRNMQAINSMQSEGADEEQIRRAQADPEIQAIIADPSVQQVLRDFKENPKYAQQAMKDPAMAGKLQKLAAAGIIRFG